MPTRGKVGANRLGRNSRGQFVSPSIKAADDRRLLENLEMGLEHLRDKECELETKVRESDGEVKEAYRNDVRALRTVMGHVSEAIRNEYPEAVEFREFRRDTRSEITVALTPELTPYATFFAPQDE